MTAAPGTPSGTTAEAARVAKKGEQRKDAGSEGGLRKAGEPTHNYPRQMGRLLMAIKRVPEKKVGKEYDRATYLLSIAARALQQEWITEETYNETVDAYKDVVQAWEDRTGRDSQSKYDID